MSYAVTLWAPDWLAEPAELSSASLALTSLAKLLRRADAYPIKAQSYPARASQLFHQPQTLPSAACSGYAELERFDSSAFWLKVDPVQLIPDRDTLLMLPPQDLALTEQESQSLLDSFNQHFAQDGIKLVYASVTSWYLSIIQPVDIHTTPLSEAVYRNLHDLFPQGHAAPYWRKLMNEAQMLFFNHPVNLARRAQGLAEVNSIWIWGEGQIDQSALQFRPQACIWGQTSYLKGLAAHTQAQFKTLPTDYQAWLNAQQDQAQPADAHLIVLPIRDQQQNLDQALSALEQDWLTGLLTGLEQGQIHSLFIDLGFEQGFLLTPKNLKRFWRWRHPLKSRLARDLV